MPTLSDKEYFAYPAISKSQLHAFTRDNPMAFWRGCLLNPKHQPVQENDAIANGKLRHTLLLEPHKAESEFLVIEGGKGFSSRETKAFQSVILANPAKTVVTQAEYDLAKLQTDTLRDYTLVNDILKYGNVEQAYFWTDKDTGLPLKAKLDLIKRLKEGLLVVEYKTTTKGFEQIERGLDIMGWHWDAGMQCKAAQNKYKVLPFQMLFVVQSQKEGEEHRIRIFCVDQNDLQTCVQYVDNALAEIKQRYERWTLGDPNAWKTDLKFHTFQGYQGTAFSFGFDAAVAAMG